MTKIIILYISIIDIQILYQSITTRNTKFVQGT